MAVKKAIKPSAKKAAKKSQMKAPAKKAPAKATWKPDYGPEAKPGSVLGIVATGYGDIEGKTKIQGKKLMDVHKELCAAHSCEGDDSKAVVMGMLRAATGTSCCSVEDIIPDGAQAKFAPMVAEITAKAAKNTEVRAAFKTYTAEVERKALETKANALKAGQAAMASSETALSKLTEKTNTLLESKVGNIEGITLTQEGKFQLTENISDEHIAEGFTLISGMVGQAEGVRENFTMAEARFAQSIETIGRDWKLFFDSESEDQLKSLKRIRQAVKALNRMDEMEVVLPGATLTTIRCVMEATYNKDDKDDNKARCGKLVENLKATYEKDGKYPPLNQVRNLVSEHKKQGGSLRHAWIYIVPPLTDGGDIQIVGTHEKDSGLANLASYTIHVGSMSFYEGALADPTKIPGPSDELLEQAKAAKVTTPAGTVDDEEEQIDAIDDEDYTEEETTEEVVEEEEVVTEEEVDEEGEEDDWS